MTSELIQVLQVVIARLGIHLLDREDHRQIVEILNKRNQPLELTGQTAQDLENEAICRLLAGRRRWSFKTDGLLHCVEQACSSISSAWYEQLKKKRKDKFETPMPEDTEFLDESPSPGERALTRDELRHLRELLGEDNELVALFYWRYVMGCEVEEAGRQLKWDRKRIEKVRRKLNRRLK